MWWGPVVFPDCVDCGVVADPLGWCKVCRLPLCDDCAEKSHSLCPKHRPAPSTDEVDDG